MGIEIESTTDTPEQVTAAMAGKVASEVETPESEDKEPQETKDDVSAASSESEDESEEAENRDGEGSEEEESDDSEEEESEEGQDKGDAQEKRNPRAEKRIKKLTSKLSQKDQRIEFLEQELERSRTRQSDDAGQGSSQNGKPNSSQSSADKPNPNDFETQEEYLEAVTDWKVEQKLSAKEEQAKQDKLRQEHQQRVNSHMDRVKEFQDTVDDFKEVLEDVDEIEMSLAVQEGILDSDNSAQLLYELAKDPKEYQRICGLPYGAALRALGRFEAKIEKSSEPTSVEKPINRTSKAPKPIKPTGGRSTRATEKSIFDEDLSFDEYKRLRSKQAGA